MALNFSQRPILPAHTSEDNLVSPLRIVNGGMPEKGGEGFDKGGSPESVSKDIIDLLPNDPFGMDDISRTFTTITGWLEDLELDYGDFMRNKIVNHKEHYRLFAGFSFFWSSAMRFQAFPTNVMYHDHNHKGFNFRNQSVFSTKSEETVNDFATCPDVIAGEPHQAFVFVLGYLRTKDLFAVERVCKSLRYTIRDDSLLWRNLLIDQPLNERITDDVLLQLTNRAEGNLQCLSLIKCPKITENGLKRVLETNPKLTKLLIPGCTRLSIHGILKNLKAFSLSTETGGIKHIRTGGFYGITLNHYGFLKTLLGIQKNNYNPHYYHRAKLSLPFDDDRYLDDEICPICQNLRLVYDCPADSCQQKDECKACIICIPRCAECGRCVLNNEYEETFSLECLCLECFRQFPRCQEVYKIQVGGFRDPGEPVWLHG